MTNGANSETSGDPKKTKTETIAFDYRLIDELRRDAELEKVSLNAFVTKIFYTHIQWERYERSTTPTNDKTFPKGSHKPAYE
jgi:hypothetical protein